MFALRNEEELEEFRNQRALISVFLDRKYNPDKIRWIFEMKEGFDAHAGNAFHLLIPYKRGYAVNTELSEENFDTELSAKIIKKLEINPIDLPCLVFKIKQDGVFFLKLGRKNRDEFLNEIAEIVEVAINFKSHGPEDPVLFQEYINKEVARHLLKKNILSTAKEYIPSLKFFLGNFIKIT
jgi:hypothetical protein